MSITADRAHVKNLLNHNDDVSHGQVLTRTCHDFTNQATTVERLVINLAMEIYSGHYLQLKPKDS